MFDIALDKNASEVLLVVGIAAAGTWFAYKHFSQMQPAQTTSLSGEAGYSVQDLESLYLMQQLGMFNQTSNVTQQATQGAPATVQGNTLPSSQPSSSNTGSATSTGAFNAPSVTNGLA